MAREEKQAATEAFEKRLNTMIREFVKAFKKMGELTNHMKEYMTREIEVLNVLVGAKDKEIAKFEAENAEYKTCLRIPR